VTAGYRILALVTDAFGGRGGIAQYNRDFLAELAGSGMMVSVDVIPRLAPSGAITPAGIRQWSPRPSRASYAMAALRAALRQPIDAVFCGHLFIAPLAMLIARLKRAKLVMQLHGVEVRQRQSRLSRLAVEAADIVLCVSRHTRATALAWAAIAPERVLVLPNTVDEAFTPGDGAALRAELGLVYKQVLLTVGRMDSRERYKGHDRVIDAIPCLVVQGHDVVYVVVGEGDDRERLAALATKAGVAERVMFVGTVGARRLIEFYRMADLFVMPSSGEGFGIVFLEAMASGAPALGLAIAGARDALADGELGTAVSENDVARTISRLLTEAKPDPSVLARAVRARFGRQVFAGNVRAAMMRLFEAPSVQPESVAK
jgi:phosphatidyl-myo-inositol dimannoside synthase